MQLTEQVAAVREFGYSPREASFVTLAALHAGCFLARQYTRTRGKAVSQLCDRITAFRHGTAQAFAHRTYVWTLHHKQLYRALGQEDNRHRRTHDAGYLRTKLMGFDYVLAHPEHEFLPTEDSKVEYFTRVRGLPLAVPPSKTYAGPDGSRTTRWFLDKYPIRLDPRTGQVAFCYIDAPGSQLPSFASWLAETAPLLRALGEAEVICVAALKSAFVPSNKEFLKEFPGTADAVPPELLEYFNLRHDIEANGAAGRSQTDLDNYRILRRRYSATKFQEHYSAWWRSSGPGDDSPAGITFSTYLLPYSYAIFGSVLAADNEP